MAFCLVFSVVITWIFNRTGESLPMVMLAHVSVKNFASVMWFAMFTTLNPYGQAANWASVVSFGAVALVLAAATRGRLGYRPGLHDDGGAKAA